MGLPGFQDKSSALQRLIASKGRYPGMKLVIRPLDSRPSLEIRQFLSYNFQSSILVPVDSFSFSFVAPNDSKKSFLEYVQEGDIALLVVEAPSGERVLATGIIDMVDIETTESGEICSVQGRDLLSQFEDQTCVNLNADPLPFGNYSIAQTMKYLMGNTRIQKFVPQIVSETAKGYLACEPGETKLTALTRYCESMNLLFWTESDGTLVVGKPDMGSDSLGRFVIDKAAGISNVTAMKATRASTSIPNIILPLWNGQEYVTARIGRSQAFTNLAGGPNTLAKRGHVVMRAIQSSLPQGGDAVSQSNLTVLTQARAAGSTFMEALAKREVARENVKELTVQVIVPGHFNDDIEPFESDTCYQIVYPRARVDEKMYCYEVIYELSAESGARTRLSFCKLGSIVADNSYSQVQRGVPKRVTPV